jgi:hypothetical protein
MKSDWGALVLIPAMAVSMPLWAADAAGRLDLEVRLSQERTPALEFTITNHMGQAISMLEASLPWVNGSIGLFLNASSDGVALQTVGMVHGSDRVLSVPDGGQLRGSLKLTDRVPGLCKALERADVILKWRFSPAVMESNIADYSGVVEIRRQSCPKD